MDLHPYLHPVPIVLIGSSCIDGRANFSTIGDAAIAGLDPPLIMISLHERHLTRENTDRTGMFSINVPEAGFLDRVDFCGIASGWETDKSEVFETDFSEEGIPFCVGMPFVHFCKTVHRAAIGKRVIYVGRIFKQIVREDIDGADLSELRTILYGLDNRYYSPGRAIGTGYREGNKYRNHDKGQESDTHKA